MYSNQEETDTKIILYCAYAQQQGYDAVQIRSPGSDVFFIALHHALKFEITILFDTDTGSKWRLLNTSDLAKEYGQVNVHSTDVSSCLQPLRYNQCIQGSWEVRPIKLLQKTEAFQETMSTLGDTWEVSARLEDDLEQFTCAVYGRGRFSSVDTACAAIWKRNVVLQMETSTWVVT